MLPKLDQPILRITIPSKGIEGKFRPMLVKEERLLLIAKQSSDPEDILLTVKQVIANCSLDDGFQVDQLAMFDVEWLFIRIRALSVSNIIEQTYEDREDGKEYKLKVDLDQIEMPDINGVNRDIDLNGVGFLRLRFPPASLYSTKKSESDALFECAEAIYNGDQVTPIDSKEEFDKWYEDLPISVSNQIDEFFSKIPSMKLDLRYTNSLGSERKIELRTLSDFFDLR
jgi:hypothetical protein